MGAERLDAAAGGSGYLRPVPRRPDPILDAAARGIRRFRTAVIFASAMLAAPVAGAAEPAIPAADAPHEELGEVVVSGEKPTKKVADMVPWLRRLVGKYTLHGHLDLGGAGRPEDRRNVGGAGTCVGFGVAPGVQCEIQVRWPEARDASGEPVLGGVSTLAPAMLLFGIEPDDGGIQFMQVDNRGVAEGALGFVTGDTATFRSPCTDVPDGCQRTTRITAVQDSQVVDVQVDTVLDFRLATRLRFEMRRSGGGMVEPRGK